MRARAGALVQVCWIAVMIWLNPATAPFARVCSTAISSTRRQACTTSMPSSRAKDSIAATVASPMPRFGMFTTRRNEMTSCGFSNSRR